MRVFKSRWFEKFARKERIADAALLAAVQRAESGLIDANYGRGVIKQRIARPNEGRSGGYRSIILFKSGDRSFFVYGFAKNRLSNIDALNESDFKHLARVLLNASETELNALIKVGEYMKVEGGD